MSISRRGWIAIGGTLAASFGVVAPSAPAVAGEFDTVIEAAQQRVVKLYGAQFGKQQGYGSGVIVAADGWIVTTLNSLLESPSLRAVLPDGRRFPATIAARDPERQLALLRIEASDLPFFELTSSADMMPGDWLIAAANPFKVAEGPEPVSVAVGVLSGRAELAARRKAQDFPYSGPVLLTDIVVATPGSAGGALVDARGRLVGVIGKLVESTRTNTLANYGLPVEEVAAFVQRARSGDSASADSGTRAAASQPAAARLLDLGLRLFDLGSRTQPPYVERVRGGSAAERSGVRAGDLILSIAGSEVRTCSDVRTLVERQAAVGAMALTVKRGDEVKTIDLKPLEGGR